MKKYTKAGMLLVLFLSFLWSTDALASQVTEPELTFEWEDDFEVPAVEEEGQFSLDRSGRLGDAAVPASYDARQRGVVTGVKNQGSFETCWAIAVSQMAESSLLSKGAVLDGSPVAPDTLDLSERHLAYFLLHPVTDPLGNTAGDLTEPLGADYLRLGGHPIFTTFALANWTGMAQEGTAPWSELESMIADAEAGGDSSWPSWIEERSALPQELAYEDAAHMQNAYWINLSLNAGHVKRAIMEYGGAVVPIYYAGNYYNPIHSSYYNDARTSENHSVFVVGWDDTYPAANFAKTPGRDGAWLVKNSYGDSWGNQGYFWVSYDDRAFTKSTGTAYVFDFAPADDYTHNYQYDGSAGRYIGAASDSYVNTLQSGGGIANIYRVPENAKTLRQTLKAVSFSLLSASVNYSIQIYKNPADPGNPESGTPMLAAPQEGSVSYVGYHTVPLSQEIALERGDVFAAVVSFSKTDGGAITYCADYSYQNGSWIRFTSATSPGQSFVKNGGWQDLNDYGAAARLKAFTDDVYQYYTIEASVGGGKGGSVTGGGQVLEGDSVTLTAAAEQGFAFVSWTENGVVISREPELLVSAVTADRSFVANFKQLADQGGQVQPEEPVIPEEPQIPQEPEDPAVPEEPAAPQEPEAVAPEDPADQAPAAQLQETPPAEPVRQADIQRTGRIAATGDYSQAELWILLLLGSSLVLAQIGRIRYGHR